MFLYKLYIFIFLITYFPRYGAPEVSSDDEEGTGAALGDGESGSEGGYRAYRRLRRRHREQASPSVNRQVRRLCGTGQPSLVDAVLKLKSVGRL